MLTTDKRSLATSLKKATADAHDVVERNPAVELVLLVPKSLNETLLISLIACWSRG